MRVINQSSSSSRLRVAARSVNGTGSHDRTMSCIIPDEQVFEYREQGTVVVKNLLSGDLLERAKRSCTALEEKIPVPTFESLAMDAWKQREDPFLEIATRSPLVAAARQLIPEAREEGLFVLKDAFFKSVGANQGCGWHVDDKFFWPAAPNTSGINIWVALDNVTSDGGGLAVAPGSHTSEFLGARDAIANGNTCALAQISPEWNARLEAMRETPTLQPGVARYSVRYVPGSTRLDGGFARVDGEITKLTGTIRDANTNGFHGLFLEVPLSTP